jgi:beta-glucosidase
VLAAFGAAEAAPGGQAEVLLRIPARLFAQWDEDRDAWIWPPGPSTVLIGRSSRDLRLSLPVPALQPPSLASIRAADL